MKLKLKTRDKQATWHGGKVYTLSLYLEHMSESTRDRVWNAIEKALAGPEQKTEKPSAIGFSMSE